MDRSSRPEVFCKKGVLGNFTKFTGEHLCQSLFLIKLLAQVFSCEFCEISKNTLLHRTPLVAASVWKIKKKSGKIKNKLRTIYPENHEILRTSSIGPNFTGSYKKRVYIECPSVIEWFDCI